MNIEIWKRFIEAKIEVMILEKEGYGAGMTTIKDIINEHNTAFTFNSKTEAVITKSIKMETPSEEMTEETEIKSTEKKKAQRNSKN